MNKIKQIFKDNPDVDNVYIKIPTYETLMASLDYLDTMGYKTSRFDSPHKGTDRARYYWDDMSGGDGAIYIGRDDFITYTDHDFYNQTNYIEFKINIVPEELFKL